MAGSFVKARMKRRHRLSMPVLSDENLEVIELYNPVQFGCPAT
jgi:hypothetical protein